MRGTSVLCIIGVYMEEIFDPCTLQAVYYSDLYDNPFLNVANLSFTISPVYSHLYKSTIVKVRRGLPLDS